MGIELEITQLGKRQATLPRVFAPLVTRRLHVQISSRRDLTYLFLNPKAISDIEKARHRTDFPGIYLNYFERWSHSNDAPRTLRLDRAYLHLIRTREGAVVSEEQLLALHSDLDCPAGDPAYRYRRGPHIHVSAGDHPFQRSHVALCLQTLEETCATLSNFDAAIRQSLELVRDEFIACLIDS